MSEDRSDDRTENIRNPKINLGFFIYNNYKDIIAFLIIIICLSIFAYKDKHLSDGLETLLITLASGAAGFIFGKHVN